MNRRRTLERLRSWGRATPWLSLAAAACGLLLSSETAGRAFALAPAQLFDGELFRLWTGHFVHYNAAHFWGDWLAFVVWAAAVELSSRRVLALTLACGSPLLSLAVLLACPELREYRGLSGLDCALVAELVLLRGFGVGAPNEHARSGALRAVALLSLAAFAAKCAYELVSGHAVFARDLGAGVALVAAAHPLGALVGLAAVVAPLAFRNRTFTSASRASCAEHPVCSG